MRLSFFILAIIIVAACAFSVAPAHADIYRYVDKDGVEHITNDFHQIPPEYQEQFLDKSVPEKSNAVLNAEKELEAATASARAARTGTAAGNVEENDEPQTILQRLGALADRYDARLPLQIAGAIAAIVAIFLGGSYIGIYLGNKKIATLICLTLSAFILIYLVSVNLRHVTDGYQNIMGKVKKLETKLNSRQESIDKKIQIPDGQENNDAETPQGSPVRLPD